MKRHHIMHDFHGQGRADRRLSCLDPAVSRGAFRPTGGATGRRGDPRGTRPRSRSRIAAWLKRIGHPLVESLLKAESARARSCPLLGTFSDSDAEQWRRKQANR